MTRSVTTARIRLPREWEVQSSHPVPKPGGTSFRRRGVASWPERSSTIPPQTADAARDSAAGGACAERDSCSASRSARPSRPRRFHPQGGPVTKSLTGPLTRRFPELGARLNPSPDGTSPASRAGRQAANSCSHRPLAAPLRPRTIPDRSGKLHRIADNSWVTIRTTI
jgi:hypothetical protein